MDFTICFQCYPTNHSSKHILLSIGLWLMNFVSIYPCQSNFVSLQRHLSNPLFKCIPPLTGWWFVKFFEINLPLKGKLYFESHIESWMVSKLQYMMTWIGNCICFSLHQKNMSMLSNSSMKSGLKILMWWNFLIRYSGQKFVGV